MKNDKLDKELNIALIVMLTTLLIAVAMVIDDVVGEHNVQRSASIVKG